MSASYKDVNWWLGMFWQINHRSHTHYKLLSKAEQMFSDWFLTFQPIISVGFENHHREACLRYLIHYTYNMLPFLFKVRYCSCKEPLPNFSMRVAQVSGTLHPLASWNRGWTAQRLLVKSCVAESESKKTSIENMMKRIWLLFCFTLRCRNLLEHINRDRSPHEFVFSA